MIILETAESFKTMDRPDPTVILFDGFISRKVLKIGTPDSLKSSICAIKI